jgi:hypothetical protein
MTSEEIQSLKNHVSFLEQHEIQSLKNDIKVLQETTKFLQQELNRLKPTNDRFKPNERTRFMNRDEILTFLLRFNRTEEELLAITNYKSLLLQELKSLNYTGKFNAVQLNEFLDKNGLSLLPFNDDMKATKEKIQQLCKEREEEYQRSKTGKVDL